MIIISTLVSLLQPVLSALSGAVQWQGLQHWYFLLGLRLLAMYFASSPWESAQQDMACAWSPGQEAETRTFCTSVCYNRHFLAPVLPTWGFSFLIALIPITIIRVLYPKEDLHGKGGQEVAASATCNKASEHRLAVESYVAARPKMGGESNMATKSNMAATVRLLGESKMVARPKVVGESNMATKSNMAATVRLLGESKMVARPKVVGESNMATKSNMAAMVQPAGDSNMAATPKLVGATNVAARDNTVGISSVTSSPAGPDMAAQPPWCAGVITMCIAVLLATEVGFLWALLARQLPMVSGPNFPCFPGTPACPPALECTVRGQADKHMALVMLALTACVSILVCLGYGGAWLGRATCCRGRQAGERAPEGGRMREGSMCCDGWEEREMGEGRVLRGDWESGEWDARTGVNGERKGQGEFNIWLLEL
ncbi:uncharacterized protein LOC120404135 [Mauremys reevesii]|uniref:uncharacterized protein LOC120404135 n=1 Tax=Mauremys reevesii TaxID=260615 RepID=UPI00193F3814|nr:uncharacterized protein LOC120404135 [Mauremys reevesii]